MAGFAGYIATLESLAFVTDAKADPKRVSGSHKINDNVVALIYFGIPSAMDFIEKFLKNSKGSITEIVQIASTAFSQNFKTYVDNPFSIILMSYHNNSPVYFSIWLDGEKPNMTYLPDTFLFSDIHNDLAEYLINKVYSPHMPIDDSINLITYVTLQCTRSFPIGYRFEITTVSSKGIKQFTDGETKDLFQKMEKVDNKLKKIFSDFFVTENINQ